VADQVVNPVIPVPEPIDGGAPRLQAEPIPPNG
jgi:hypothetical protein